jgi:hypothetical protein
MARISERIQTLTRYTHSHTSCLLDYAALGRLDESQQFIYLG